MEARAPIRYATGSSEPFAAASGTLRDLTWLENCLTSKWWSGSCFTALATPLTITLLQYTATWPDLEGTSRLKSTYSTRLASLVTDT